MFSLVRCPEPRRRPIGGPGVSEEQFDRIRARLREQQADHFPLPTRGAANRLTFQPITINEGTRS